MHKLLKGKSPDIISTNVNTLKNAGYSHASATRCAMCHANKKHNSDAKRISAKVAKKDKSAVKIKS